MPVHPLDILAVALRALINKGNALVGKAKAAFRAEPAVLIGTGISAALAVQNALVAGNAHTWREAVPVITSLLVRQFVTAPDTLDAMQKASVKKALDEVMTLVSKKAAPAPPR